MPICALKQFLIAVIVPEVNTRLLQSELWVPSKVIDINPASSRHMKTSAQSGIYFGENCKVGTRTADL